jgi:heme-degrading monooxygenase HmoA
MVEEIAFIEVADGQNGAFEDAVRRAAVEIFPKCKGFVSLSLGLGVEKPNTYALKIVWENIEDHTKGFVESELFNEWVVLVTGILAGTPVVEHWQPIDVG